MFNIRSLEVKVYLEGYLVKVKRLVLKTGKNTLLNAQVTIPSSKWAQEIIPGTRIHVYKSISGEADIAWFQGTVSNKPNTSAGDGAKDITLMVQADLAILGSASIDFIDLINTQGDPSNSSQRVILKAEGGSIRIPVNAGLTSMTPFASISDTKLDFASRIYGILQSILMMHPDLYNFMRRTHLLERLVIDINKNAEQLDKIDYMNNLVAQLNRLSAKKTNAWEILGMILKSIFHDIVSVAPMMKANTKLPLRSVNMYLPKDYDITSTGQPDSLFDKMKSLYKVTKKDHVTFTDHIIKPELYGMTVPSVNYLYGEDDLVFDIGFKRLTRMLAEMPILLPGLSQLLINKRPYELKTAMEIAMRYTDSARGESSLKHALYSLLVSSLGTDYRTNEEKIFGRVIPAYWRGDHKMAQFLMTLQNKNDREAFFEDWMDIEYLKMSGVAVGISGPLNFDPICGFPMEAYDTETGNNIRGMLVAKTDIVDFEAEVATSTYTLEAASLTKSVDYNQPRWKVTPGEVPTLILDGAEKMSDIFFEENRHYTDPAYMNIDTYNYTGLVISTLNMDMDDTGSHARKDNVSFYESLAMNNAIEVDSTRFIADERSPQNYENDTGKPSLELVEKVNSFYRVGTSEIYREKFYIYGDMLPYVIEKTFLRGTSDEAQKKGLKLLDSRQGSIFSMFYTVNKKPVFVDQPATMDWFYRELGPNVDGNTILGVEIDGYKSLWDGNPCANKTELLMHYLSPLIEKVGINKVWGEDISAGNIPTEKGELERAFIVDRNKGEKKYRRLSYLPRPLSESEVISIRRWVVQKLYEENKKYVK